MWQMWLIVAGFFLLLEIATTGFLVFWFSLGAVITMVFSFFIKSEIAQFVIFIVSSTILLFSTKSLVAKITKKDSPVKTNAYAIEGKIGRVTKDIEPIEGTGQVKISGEVWSAKSYNDTFIAAGTEVVISSIDGVKAIVTPLKEKKEN